MSVSQKKLHIGTMTLDFFKQKKSYVFAYFFLILAYPLGSIIVPHYYGKLMELMAAGKDMSKTFITTLAFWAIYACGTFGLTRIDSALIPEFRSYLYHKIAKFIFEIHKEDYASIKIGELVSKLSKLPYLILEIFYQLRTCYLPLFYMIVFCLIYFFSINVKLGAIILSVLCCFGGVALLSIANCMPSCVHAETSGDLANENLQDILENILSVYSADNIDGELNAFHDKNTDLRKHMRRCMSCASKFKFSFNALYLVSFIAICTYAYKLYQNKSITLAQISSALIVMVYLLSQVDSTMQYTQETIAYVGSVIDIQNYINNLNEKYENTTSHIDNLNKNQIPLYTGHIDNIEGQVDFQNIDLCFAENCVLKNFSYRVEAKKKLAIVGKVGSGKSSLLKMVLKLAYPNMGQILIDGKNLPYNITRKYVSYINQTPVLFNRSLYENIVYGTKKTKEDVKKVLQKYNLENIFGNRNLDDLVGKAGNNLSGGQKQIVMILRTVLRESSIVLLDEPTTALDNDRKEMIMDLIFEVFADKTMIMITHDSEIVERFDHVLDLNNF
jgi:ABC-type bacteriocin/lantibiotic exporter with double-glycine peptidase domain